jgi:hypothetical protein
MPMRSKTAIPIAKKIVAVAPALFLLCSASLCVMWVRSYSNLDVFGVTRLHRGAEFGSKWDFFELCAEFADGQIGLASRRQRQLSPSGSLPGGSHYWQLFQRHQLKPYRLDLASGVGWPKDPIPSLLGLACHCLSNDELHPGNGIQPDGSMWRLPADEASRNYPLVTHYNYVLAAVPIWMAVLATAAPGACWLVREARRGRRRRRARLGLCPACAYDLRSTPDPGNPLLFTCPECGRPTVNGWAS